MASDDSIAPPPPNHRARAIDYLVAVSGWRKAVICAAIALCFATLWWLRTNHDSGVELTTRGDVLEYRFSSWVLIPLAMPVLAGLAISVVFLTMRTWLGRLIGLAMLAFGISIVVMGVSCLHGGLTVSAEGFHHVAGFSWSPVVHDIRFADTKSLTVVAKRSDTGLRYELECESRDGATVTIPFSTVMKEGIAEILNRARQNGVSASLPPAADNGDNGT